MAFVDDYKPSQFSWPHMTLSELQQLGERRIWHWNGSIDTADTGNAERPRNSLRIVVDADERHLLRRPGTAGPEPTPGVLIVAACNDNVQLHEFLMATPVVAASEVEEVVGRFKAMLRPTVELATRVQWASDLAELRQLHDYATRYPTAVEVHRHRHRAVVWGEPRIARMQQLEQWLATPELYPIEHPAVSKARP